MIKLDLKVDGLDKLRKKYANFHIENPKAISRSMNTASEVARTQALAHTRKAWNLRARDLKKKTSLKKATVSNAEVVFKMHSTPVNLNEFFAKDITTGVSYKIQKKRKKLKSAFRIGTGRNQFVMRRVDDKRYPIIPFFSVTPSWMFHKEGSEKVFIRAFYLGKDGAGRGFKKTYIDQLHNLLDPKK